MTKINKYDRIGGFWFSLANLLAMLAVSSIVGLGVAELLYPFVPISAGLLLQICAVATLAVIVFLDVHVCGD